MLMLIRPTYEEEMARIALPLKIEKECETMEVMSFSKDLRNRFSEGRSLKVGLIRRTAGKSSQNRFFHDKSPRK